MPKPIYEGKNHKGSTIKSVLFDDGTVLIIRMFSNSTTPNEGVAIDAENLVGIYEALLNQSIRDKKNAKA